MSAHASARYKTMQESARHVAKDFLQSVVVVDDEALMGTQASRAELKPPIEGGSARDSTFRDRSRVRRPKTVLRSPAVDPKGEPTPEQSLDAKILIDGFAQQGLVCAVIRPAPGENPVEKTVKAASRADIVVLDWELNSDSGNTSMEIIGRIVHHEDSGARGRLRLIAIYSGAEQLRTISLRIQKSLAALRSGITFRRDGEFVLTAGLVRIVILSKPTTRYKNVPAALRALQERVVTTTQLPERLIAEFSELTMGLVPHVALASLAALRKNTHRILGRLRAELDPAYLWHRAAQVRPADAEEHLVDLVSSELHSVLQDERVGAWADINAIRQWIAQDGRHDYAQAFNETATRSSTDIEELLTKGAAGKGEGKYKEVREKFKYMCVERDAHKKDIAAFAADATQANSANEHLASLMSLRTRYENPPPRLELGTILSSGRGETRKFWLCVQPRCDSVRLIGKARFPLLPLEASESKSKFDILLPSKPGYRRLRVSKKPADLQSQVFYVNPADGDTVLATRRSSGFAFRTSNGRYYRWEADLKPDHAQRIVQQVANEFSRVGLSESEWLRLWANK